MAQIWESFTEKHNLTPKQINQFEIYLEMLVSWNELFNLTAIVGEEKILLHHFQDSLAIIPFIESSQNTTSIIDVGTGAGFPGIPLKIKFPQVKMILVEVTAKKRHFLEEVIQKLGLTEIIISSYDWRTFLRQTTFSADIVCSRASLPTEELIRMFKPSSPYKHATLVYWASIHWKPEIKVASHIYKEERYAVANRKSRLIFFTEKIPSSIQ